MEVYYFQFKPIWTSYSAKDSSLIMKKGSQYTRFFTQEMRRLTTTGNIDFLKKRYYAPVQSCKSLLKEKSLGYEKLSFLFAILLFGCIVSILFVVLEYMIQSKKMKGKLKANEKEISFLERKFGEYLEGLSDEETENILSRLNQRHFKK